MRDNSAVTREEAERLLAENAALRAELVATKAELAAVKAKLDAVLELAAEQNERLSVLTDMMRRKLQRAPTRAPDPSDDDPKPPGSAAPVDAQEPEDIVGIRPARRKDRRKRKGGRRKPTSDLPAVEERHTPEVCAQCGGDHLLCRDVEVSEKFDIVRAHVRCRRIVREVKVCSHCRATTTAEMPPMPCPRAGYTIEFLAWLVVQKFVLLVPLDRTRRLLLSQGVDIPESTLVHLIDRAADLLGAIDGEHWKQLKAGNWMAFDATGLKVCVPWRSTTWLGYLDVFTRDALTVYQFSMTKHGNDLAAKLDKFRGTLLCDAESRHNEVFSDDRLEANCNAHPRRKFRDGEKVQPTLAAVASDFMQQMYQVEDDARMQGLTGTALLAERQARTRPVVDRFKEWLAEVEPSLLPTDPLGKPVRYYLKHFDGLTRFVDDPDIPIDNNRSERAFQNHAKLRLNALFAGSPEGAHRWATILGVVETAQRLGLDVHEYLVWAFERRGTWKQNFGLSAAQTTPAAYKQMLEERQARAAVA